MKCILLLLASMASMMALSTAVVASGFDDCCQSMIDESAQVLTSLEDKAHTDGISMSEIEQYLYNALVMVYHGKCNANDRYDNATRETNEDLSKLAELGLIPFWPNNPITWEPMKVLGLGDEFSPGDLYLAVCSGDYVTTVGGTPFANSFDLFVFGPEEALGSFGEIYQCKINREWSTPPPGALYGYSYYTTADREKLKIDELTRKYKEQQAAKEAETTQADEAESQENTTAAG